MSDIGDIMGRMKNFHPNGMKMMQEINYQENMIGYLIKLIILVQLYIKTVSMVV